MCIPVAFSFRLRNKDKSGWCPKPVSLCRSYIFYKTRSQGLGSGVRVIDIGPGSGCCQRLDMSLPSVAPRFSPVVIGFKHPLESESKETLEPFFFFRSYRRKLRGPAFESSSLAQVAEAGSMKALVFGFKHPR